MKNKKWIIPIIMIFILIIYIVMSRPKDDLALMEKLISKHLNTNQSLVLYNSINVDNHSLMSYILSSKDKYQGVGYAHFKVGDNGKYELLNIVQPDKTTEKASDITIYEFSKLKEEFSELITDEVKISKSLFVISNNPELSRFERIMENGEIAEIPVDSNPIPGISFFNDLGDNNIVGYNFYNKNGDIIK